MSEIVPNKIVYHGNTLIDLTADTVTVSDVALGKIFHLPSGAIATGTLQGLPYGVCETPQSDPQKDVTISGITTITVGLTIAVKMMEDSIDNASLAVNELGYIDIYAYGDTPVSSNVGTTGWIAGELLILCYDGYGWQMNKSYSTDTTYSQANLHTTGLTVGNHGTATISYKTGGDNGVAPTLGDAFIIPNVTAVGEGSFSTVVSDNILSFEHTHTAPTLGVAFIVPNVTSVGSASSWVFDSISVVTSPAHTITDEGHTHTLQ